VLKRLKNSMRVRQRKAEFGKWVVQSGSESVRLRAYRCPMSDEEEAKT